MVASIIHLHTVLFNEPSQHYYIYNVKTEHCFKMYTSLEIIIFGMFFVIIEWTVRTQGEAICGAYLLLPTYVRKLHFFCHEKCVRKVCPEAKLYVDGVMGMELNIVPCLTMILNISSFIHAIWIELKTFLLLFEYCFKK